MASVKFPVPEAIKMLDFDKRKTPDNKATECTCSLRELAVLYSRDGRAACMQWAQTVRTIYALQ